MAGYLTVTHASPDAAERAYGMTEEQEAVLVQEDNAAHVSPLASLAAGIGAVLDRVADAYRTGEGVPYAAYGADFRQGQGGINRPAFMHDLPGSWIPALPEVHEKLEQGRARVADVGCGQGWAALGVASAFPGAEVIGIDTDKASIDEARKLATEQGIKARFEHADAESLHDYGPFDLVMILEVMHDLTSPVEVLRAVRKSLAPGGVVLVADELVADSFTAPGDLLERMMFGWSITHCLPSVMGEESSAELGTVLRSDTVRDIASKAGLEGFEVLDVDGGFFRLYRLAE